MGVASDKKVAEMTLGELKEVIREAILETLDPDYGLELRNEVVQALQKYFQEKKRGEGIALEEARNRLGLR
jgi:septum formation topological specificity factor MinE